jgi:hypothetical protein
MPIERRALYSQAVDLVGSASQLFDLVKSNDGVLSDDDERKVRELIASINARLPELGTAMGARLERAAPSDFAEFFTAVGTSLVKAQRALDMHTENYLSEVQQRPHLLPSVFRIPTLSADIRFALTNATEERLNVIFHSGSREARDENQQAVHFEIVAAPPPPGVLEDTMALAWRPVLVVSPREREAVLADFRLLAKDPAIPKAERDALETKVLPDPDGTLIFRSNVDGEFFLVAAHEEARDIGSWHLRVGEHRELHAAYLYYRAPGTRAEVAGMESLHQYVFAACGQQRAFLQRLQPRG